MRSYRRLAPLVLVSVCVTFGAARAQKIRAFCTAAKQHVAADSQLSQAVRQVFGEPNYSVASEQDAACIYPLKILRYGSADVLLTTGNEPGQACHGCAASLSAYVLARTGGGLKLVNEAIDFGQTGTFGNPGDISPVRIGPDDGIAIENGGMFQGHSFSGLDFYAFHAGRVLHVASSPPIGLAASDSGAVVGGGPATDVSGSWTMPSPTNDMLRVDYRLSVGKRRSRASATWRLVGERWVLSGGEIPKALDAGR